MGTFASNAAVLAAVACLTAACGERAATAPDKAPSPGVSQAASAQAGAARPAAGGEAAGFAGVADVFRVSAAGPAAPQADAAGAVPFARPDLSADYDERSRAQLVRQALIRNDMEAARQLANTRALREMVGQEEAQYAVFLRESAEAARSDTEVPGRTVH